MTINQSYIMRSETKNQILSGYTKKVLFVHHFPDYSGAAESMLTLIRNLDPARYTASVLIVHPVAEPLLSAIRSMGIPAQHLSVRLVWDSPWYSRENLQTGAWRAFRSDPQVAKYLCAERPDIVHINEFVPVSVGYTARELGIPVVWHCRHVLVHLRHILDPGQRIIRAMAAIANSIVCISEAEAAIFPESTTKVIYNPLNVAKVEAGRGRGVEARKSLGIGATEYVVTAPVLLSRSKGAWDFIRACGVASRLASDVSMRFLLVGYLPAVGRRHLLRKWTGFLGPRSDLARAQNLARRLGIEGRIQFTGFRSDIYAIMDGSDLIVFPSHLRACGRPCFEAGALQKPIIVTLPNKNSGIVLDGETGLILPEKAPGILGKAIANLARDRVLGVRMGEQGAKHVRKNFDAGTHAINIMAIYDGLYSEHKLQSKTEIIV